MGESDTSNNVKPVRTHSVRTAGLILILLVSRAVVLDHPTPVHGDETEFIRAIGLPAVYPVHQPGYPLWVAMGSFLAWCGAPAYAAYQAWSVVFSVMTPWVFYLALRREVGDGLAWWMALALGLCPLMWFLGATALNYTAASAAVMLVVLAVRRAMIERQGALVRWAAAGLALSMLLRPDLLLWVGPLVVTAAWRFKWIERFIVVGLLAVGTGAVIGVQGWVYGRATSVAGVPQIGHTLDVILNTSVFRLGAVDGLVRNGVKLAAIGAWQVGLPVLIAFAGCLLFKKGRTVADDGRSSAVAEFVVLWMLPLVAFLIVVHMTEAGHILVLVPAVYWLIAFSLAKRCRGRTAISLAILIAAVSAVQFVAYPWSAQSRGFKRTVDAKVAYVSMAGLRHIDERETIHTPGDYWRTDAHDAAPADANRPASE